MVVLVVVVLCYVVFDLGVEYGFVDFVIGDVFRCGDLLVGYCRDW